MCYDVLCSIKPYCRYEAEQYRKLTKTRRNRSHHVILSITTNGSQISLVSFHEVFAFLFLLFGGTLFFFFPLESAAHSVTNSMTFLKAAGLMLSTLISSWSSAEFFVMAEGHMSSKSMITLPNSSFVILYKRLAKSFFSSRVGS
mmetsp:Transcript_5068/g.9632  ORF Transcript_5068/g.9632 Transcript_5068/m.9632 type:complete len:144 (-) Transcript_5068:559-990(-)